mmetsp:Transcript_7767/g.23501  ORF Transcript_7767/g.23501 Transcript_7767/m.23501 type:complete len:291 (-) Transcript_7767:7-879(-)
MKAVRAPNADVHFSARPRIGAKIREEFETLGGLAKLKLGADYVMDPAFPGYQQFNMRYSLRDKFFGAKMAYRDKEVSLTKNLWLDGRTRVSLWISVHVSSCRPALGFKISPFRGSRSTPVERTKRETTEAEFASYTLPPLRVRNELLGKDSALSLQVDTRLQFNPYVAYSTDNRKVGLGRLQISLDQLSLVLRPGLGKFIPRSMVRNKILAPANECEVQEETAWSRASENTTRAWAGMGHRLQKATRSTTQSVRNGLNVRHWKMPPMPGLKNPLRKPRRETISINSDNEF